MFSQIDDMSVEELLELQQKLKHKLDSLEIEKRAAVKKRLVDSGRFQEMKDTLQKALKDAKKFGKTKDKLEISLPLVFKLQAEYIEGAFQEDWDEYTYNDFFDYSIDVSVGPGTDLTKHQKDYIVNLLCDMVYDMDDFQETFFSDHYKEGERIVAEINSVASELFNEGIPLSELGIKI